MILLKKLVNRNNIFLLTGIIIIIILSYKCYRLKLDRDDNKSLYQSVSKENKIWQDQSDLWRNRTESIVVSKHNLDQIKELENLSKEFEGVKRNLKNLENYIGISSTTNIHETVRVKDTTIYVNNIAHKAKTFGYTDKFDTINCVIDSNKATFDIKHTEKLEVVQYWDRKWFLAKKITKVEIKSLNPNTQITEQKSIKVERKRGLSKFL